MRHWRAPLLILLQIAWLIEFSKRYLVVGAVQPSPVPGQSIRFVYEAVRVRTAGSAQALTHGYKHTLTMDAMYGSVPRGNQV